MNNEATTLSQLATLRLGSLGLNFQVLLPGELDVWADHPDLPPGTILLSTGTGGWNYGERYVIHDRIDRLYRTVDLARGIVVEMHGWEIAASFVQVFTEERYPYLQIEQSQAAARQGIMLFTPPLNSDV